MLPDVYKSTHYDTNNNLRTGFQICYGIVTFLVKKNIISLLYSNFKLLRYCNYSTKFLQGKIEKKNKVNLIQQKKSSTLIFFSDRS